MFKKLINWLLIAIIMAAPAGAAFALPNEGMEEQIIKQEVIVGYFDIWKGTGWLDTNNDGYPDQPGQTGKLTKPFNYSAAELLKNCQITRVEVQYPFSDEEYTAAGGRHSGPDGKPWIDQKTGQPVMAYEDFDRNYLDYLPQNLNVKTLNQNLNAGKTEVQWGLDLPNTPETALDIKNPVNRDYIGYEPANISNMVEGWRWYLPAIITWYGVPNMIPDLSTTLEVDKFKDVKPGDVVTSTVTFTLNKDHPQSELAWLRLHHFSGDGEYAIPFEPLNPADTLDANGYIEIKPGESKTYKFTFTVQDKPSKIVSRINPVNTDQDKNWANNRDEAFVFMDNLWVEITDYTKEAQVGGIATVKAKIHNGKGELLTTRLVWKVNGVTVKDIGNYDLIGTIDDSINFTMPNGNATVTVEVNPDHDRPSNELSYDDNKASCTIIPIAVITPPNNEANRLKIKITAPSKVDPFKQWSYTVTVITNYPPPPPPPPGEEAPPPPTITMNVSATGQTSDLNIGYQFWNDGYQKIDQVKRTDSKTFRAKGWGYQEHHYSYVYPGTGLWGNPAPVTIKASATSSRDDSASTSATVIVNPIPIPGVDLSLTK